ncbi:MAG: ATP-grasp domain-containing protein [bacterium]
MMDKKFLLSGSESHCICMNKYLSNMVVQDIGFTVPQSCLIQHIDDIKTCKIKGKIFVKPNHGGSSVDTGVFEDIKKAKKLIQTILKYDDIIVQQAIKGREFTVSVIGDYNKKVTPIAVTEVITSREFFDFEAKYQRAGTEEITPAQIDKKMQTALEKMSVAIYKRMKLKTLSRIDFLYNKGGFYFLEVNTIPGMTDKSFLPQALAYYGYTSLGEFLEESIRNI